MKLRSLKMAGLLVLPMVLVGCNQHTHTFSDEWSSDDTYHWHAATCEHTDVVKDKAEHTWGDPVVTKAATCTEAGEQTYTCTVCEHTKTEPIGPLGHLITDWEIQHNPLTMTYEVGDTLDLTGFSAKGICENCHNKFDINNNEITVKYNTGTSFVVGDTSVKLVYKQIEKVLNGITINKPKNDFDNIPEYSYETVCGVFPDTSKATPKYDDDGEAELTVGIYKGDTYQEDQMVEITDPKDLVHDDTGEVEYWVRLDVNETTHYAANRKYVGITVEHDLEEPTITNPSTAEYNAFDYFDPTGFKIEISCSVCDVVDTYEPDDCFFVNQDGDYLVDPWGDGEEEVVPLHVGDQILCQYGSEEIDLVEECGITISKVTEEIENFTSVATTCCCEPEFAIAPTGKYGGVEATVKYYDSNDGEGTEITDWSDITADSVGTAPVYAQASLPATTDYDAVKSNFIEVSVTHDHNWVVGTGQDDYKCACGDVSRSFITHVDGEFNFGLSNSHTTVDVDLTGLSGQGGVAYTVSSDDDAVTAISGNVATVNGETLFADHVIGKKETKSITFTATETVSGDKHTIPVAFTCVDNLITNYEELKAVTPTSATNNVTGYFMLGNDLNLGLSKTTPYFDPGVPTIGTDHGFGGTFDGNGHTIDHFYTKGMGLFTTLMTSAVIKDVKFTNAGLMNISVTGWARAGYAPLLARNVANATIQKIDVDFEYIDPNYNPSDDSIAGSFLVCTTVAGQGWCRMEDITIDATCVDKVRWAIGVESFNANASCGTEGGATHDPVTKNIKIYVRDYQGICRDNSQSGTELVDFTRLKGFEVIKTDGQLLDIDNVYHVVGEDKLTVDAGGVIGDDAGLWPDSTLKELASDNVVDWSKVSIPAGNYKVCRLFKDNEYKGVVAILNVTAVVKDIATLRALFDYRTVEETQTYPEPDPRNRVGYYVQTANVSCGNSWVTQSPGNTNENTFGFRGVFDGRGHTIDAAKAGEFGIFGYLGKGGLMKNVTCTRVLCANNSLSNVMLARFINGFTMEDCSFTAATDNAGIAGAYFGKFASFFVGVGYAGRCGWVDNTSRFVNVTFTDANTTSDYHTVGNKPGDTYLACGIFGANTHTSTLTPFCTTLPAEFENVEITVTKVSLPDADPLVYGYYDYNITDGTDALPIEELPQGVNLTRTE
ncbi:MAG: hypothetical protein MJ213_01430 [Bacilli bacterium]|nr:hypothetical protein [Bacilli bacterium]